MIEDTPIDKHIEQMTFSFITEGNQMWFPWFEEKVIDPKPRRRTKLRKNKSEKND